MKKENQGGTLTNEQLEQDLKVRQSEEVHGYRGSQDTGDKKVRSLGTEVQKQDGMGEVKKPDREG